MPLFIVFVLMPLAEVIVLLEVGSRIGLWPTVLCIVLTATLGVMLLRQQGVSVLLRGVRRAEAGGLPAQELLEAFVLAIGGALLLTPGFITDAIGFACLVPPSRAFLVRRLLVPRLRTGAAGTAQRTVRIRMVRPGAGPWGPAGPGADPRGPRPERDRDGRRGETIEGEYTRRD